MKKTIIVIIVYSILLAIGIYIGITNIRNTEAKIKDEIESVLVPFIDTVSSEIDSCLNRDLVLLNRIKYLDSVNTCLQNELSSLKERIRWNYVLTYENSEDIFRLHRWHWAEVEK